MDHHPNYFLITQHLLRAVVLAGIGFYVARLSAVGHLHLYIAPRMSICTKLAAAGLYLIAAALVHLALREWNGERPVDCGDACCRSTSGSRLRHLRVFGLFAVPLAVFFLTPDTTIGSAMAAQKGMNVSGATALQGNRIAAMQTNAQAAPSPAAPAAPSASPTGATDGRDAPPPSQPARSDFRTSELDRLFPHDSLTKPYAEFAMKLYSHQTIEIKEKNFLETLSTLAFFPDPFVGRKATITGFVYRDDTIGKGQFVLGRFAVQCCAADAIPYGIIVESGEEKRYANDEWMTVTGTLTKAVYDGNEVLLLKADKALKIKPAADPYVYPDPDFNA